MFCSLSIFVFSYLMSWTFLSVSMNITRYSLNWYIWRKRMPCPSCDTVFSGFNCYKYYMKGTLPPWNPLCPYLFEFSLRITKKHLCPIMSPWGQGSVLFAAVCLVPQMVLVGARCAVSPCWTHALCACLHALPCLQVQTLLGDGTGGKVPGLQECTGQVL